MKTAPGLPCQDVLGPEALPVLAHLAWSNVLLGFDYDGTLAPIVDDPVAARMRTATRRLFRRLARAYPCIVMSGRAHDDLRPRLEGANVFEAIGNHGIEPWYPPERYASQVLTWTPVLRENLRPVQGVSVEDKVLSITVHFRHANDRELARARILDAAGRLRGARVMGGDCAVNVVPQGAPHKGTSLTTAQELLGCSAALYVGDDETDEDVFSLADQVLTVRVTPSPASSASYFVADQPSVDTLLGRLLELRVRRSRRPH
jgi:trehalose 6-phosphate phosphatase